MRQTTYTPLRAAYSTVRSMQTHVQRWRHRLTPWARMVLPSMAGAIVPQHAGATRLWGYRRAGLDFRSDRDIDSAFCIRTT